MKNTPEAAIMYDMISYSVIYFNKSTAVEFLKRETGIPEEDTLLQAYNEFTASCHLEVPPNVYPFFILMEQYHVPCPKCGMIISRRINNIASKYVIYMRLKALSLNTFSKI